MQMEKECTPKAKLGPGALVIVVGPSGAGKDTLIYGYKDQCKETPHIFFARRLITRAADSGTEPHDTVCHQSMEELIANGEVALSWPAHGLRYALPKIVDEHIRIGGIAIANGSRKVLLEAAAKYERLLVVHVTAPVSVLAERLAARGRETAEDIERRLERADLSLPPVPHLVEIQNTADPQTGVTHFKKAIDEFMTRQL